MTPASGDGQPRQSDILYTSYGKQVTTSGKLKFDEVSHIIKFEGDVLTIEVSFHRFLKKIEIVILAPITVYKSTRKPTIYNCSEHFSCFALSLEYLWTPTSDDLHFCAMLFFKLYKGTMRFSISVLLHQNKTLNMVRICSPPDSADAKGENDNQNFVQNWKRERFMNLNRVAYLAQ